MFLDRIEVLFSQGRETTPAPCFLSCETHIIPGNLETYLDSLQFTPIF